jgi:hypothetical protein
MAIPIPLTITLANPANDAEIQAVAKNHPGVLVTALTTDDETILTIKQCIFLHPVVTDVITTYEAE